MIKNSLIAVTFLLIFSCKSNETYTVLNNEISHCIKERVKQDPIYKENYNLVVFLEEVENIMLNNNLLEGKDKTNYIDLFMKLKDKSISQNQLTLFVKELKVIENYMILQNSININNTPFECNRFLIEKNKLNLSDLAKFHNALTQYFKNGTIKNDWELNSKMIKSLPNEIFEIINYRLPIIVLTHDNILLLNEDNS